MIGNNACGAHTVAYGRTVDNVQSITVVDGLGRRLSTAAASGQVPGLNQLIDSRTRGDPEGTRHLRSPDVRVLAAAPAAGARPESTKAMVGTEGTLGVILDDDSQPRTRQPGADARGARLRRHGRRGRRGAGAVDPLPPSPWRVWILDCSTWSAA